jgi:hypothetical protein
MDGSVHGGWDAVIMRGLDPRIHRYSVNAFSNDGLPGHRQAKRRRSSSDYTRQ